MAYPAYIQSIATVLIGLILPLFVVLSFAFVIPPVLKRIVQEKQTGAKELMKMMGLPSWMNWLFYLFDALLGLVVIVAIMAIIATVKWTSDGKIIEFSDGSIIFFFLLIYAVALVVFLFTISTIFSNRKFWTIFLSTSEIHPVWKHIKGNQMHLFSSKLGFDSRDPNTHNWISHCVCSCSRRHLCQHVRGCKSHLGIDISQHWHGLGSQSSAILWKLRNRLSVVKSVHPNSTWRPNQHGSCLGDFLLQHAAVWNHHLVHRFSAPRTLWSLSKMVLLL